MHTAIICKQLGTCVHGYSYAWTVFFCVYICAVVVYTNWYMDTSSSGQNEGRRFFWTHYYSHRRHNRRTLVGARTKCEVVDGEDPLDIFHTLAIILFPKKGYSSVRSEEKVIDI